MKLNYDKKSKDPTYFIQMGIRNGKKTTTKNVARIGKHSELLKITNDPLSYAKQQVLLYNQEVKNQGKACLELKVDFAKKIKATDKTISNNNKSNIGYFFLQKIYKKLDLEYFFEKVTKDMKNEFDPNLVNRFITYSRILHPQSKLSTHSHIKHYYEKPDFDYIHILRTMDIMQEHYDEYITHLFEKSSSFLKRDKSVCFYDCTNFYFEIENPDEDYVDPVTGEYIKGLRKYGFSKDHKPNPIVQMGLFMDKDGIPLSMCITPGSDNEQTTVIPLEDKLIRMFKGKKFIYCADAGLSSYHIRNFNSMGGRAFVVTQSIKKLSNELKKEIFKDSNYYLLSNDTPISFKDMKVFDKFDEKNKSLYLDKAYKVIYADKAYDVGLYEEKTYANGKVKKVKSKATLKQKIIITFSRKTMEYQRYIRDKQIERAKKLLKNLDPQTYKKGPNDITRFIKKKTNSSNDEVYELDTQLIKKEQQYDGFYAIATNLEDDAKTIIKINQGRYKIEECFRIMKTDFSAHPVYHSNPNRIVAHFMICYTALLIYRLLEKLLTDKVQHFTSSQIIETLNNMEVANIEDLCYMSLYDGSKVCDALNFVFDLGLDKKYYQAKDLNKKIKEILK